MPNEPRAESVSVEILFGRKGNSAACELTGWSDPEDGFTWMIGQSSMISIRIPPMDGAPYLDLTLLVIPFVHGTELPSQRLSIAINGPEVGAAVVDRETTLSFRIPASMITAGGRNLIELKHPDAARPRDIVKVSDDRLLSFMVRHLGLLAVLPETVRATAIPRTKARVAIVGHSHLAGLESATTQLAATGVLPFDCTYLQFLRAGRPHILNLDGKWQYDPQLGTDMRKHLSDARPDAVVFMLQGEQSIFAGLLPKGQFAFYLPGESISDEIERYGPLVPYDAVVESYSDDYAMIDEFLNEHSGFLSMPAFAISPPPPVGDNSFILQHLEGQPIYETLKTRGLPAAGWRSRIWKASTDSLRLIYEKHNIQFIPPVEDAYDESRCLASRYYYDAFHANPKYAALVVAQIASLLYSPET
jgi:hypothetical protein